MNISLIINQLSILFQLLPFKIYNQLTNNTFVILNIDNYKSYIINYNSTNNIRSLHLNNNSFKQNIFAY